MEYSEWFEIYNWIRKLLGISYEKDVEATLILAQILKGLKPPLNELSRLIKRRKIIVFGAGPSLDPVLEDIIKYTDTDLLHRKYTLFAADGVTQALLEYNIVPHLVTTDLDGDIEALMWAAKKGSLMLIHGHGDNIDKITSIVPIIKKITSKIIGTTQVKPIPPLQNFGGFTDGDRAVFISHHFKASKIIMVGMDFGSIVGRRSKPWLKNNEKAWPAKKIKLDIAFKLISQLACKEKILIYTVSDTVPQCVKKVSVKEIHLL
ncbi:6-hydroxymethylpterin diphosphokinase MptE-like protein [Staphylothermus hellenicus]|uniref:6-hydroxymethyl-7,8-dihydropterin pyrophosphokinase n=1 Tax=Staphylothermus hellenicus (strain DSM 12710 / JCM 10830 / BK20S6-10-b1 / P8) TaxID=591019 RepID=D7D9L5_STAHD|nr:6-hydroxymethylpterin diphosphokinase MptE-like protein [Staphylothermus hellenicus]ADI32461.1 protein of unknown function DUF115 [Staphylothermus hellenicus DSM 12710]